MIPRLLLATNNFGKLAEYDVLLEGCGWELVTPRDLGIDLEVDETGETYEANATMKARRGAEASGLVTLADDSGIEIEAMGGKPGVRSARFLGEDASYAERFAEIQRQLANVPRERRRAGVPVPGAARDPLVRGNHAGNARVRRPRGREGAAYGWRTDVAARPAEARCDA